jgi:hypothetical protein
MVNILRRRSNPLPFEGGVEIGGSLLEPPSNDRAPDATIRGDEIVSLATFSKCHGQRRTSLRPAVGWLRE